MDVKENQKPGLRSALVLLGSSLVSIVLALWLAWNIFEVVVLYWIEALIIGVFHRRKVRDMIDAHAKSGRSDYVRGRRLLLRHDSHKGFGIIYGLFWLMEGALLLAKYVTETGLSVNSLTLLFAVSVLVLSHLFSYRQNRATDQHRPPTVETVMLMPLLRMVLPLHIFTLTVGFDTDYGAGGILAWMLLKTAVDLGIHVHEHTNAVV